MKKFLLIVLMPFTLVVNAAANYAYGEYWTATLEDDDLSTEADMYGGELGFAGGVGNMYFGSSAGWGTVEWDDYSVELDFAAWTVEGGYAFSDIANGAFIIGAQYVSTEIQNPLGGDNIEDSDTNVMIGYGKMSGEGVDYVMTYTDSFFQSRLFFPFGENLTANVSFGMDDDGNKFGVGIAFKY